MNERTKERTNERNRVLCAAQLYLMMVYQKLEAVPKATTIMFTFTAMTLLLYTYRNAVIHSCMYSISRIRSLVHTIKCTQLSV